MFNVIHVACCISDYYCNRNEIESQLQAVNRDIQYYQQQQQSLMSGQYSVQPHAIHPNFPHGNG